MLNMRPATPNDVPEILKLIRELAAYAELVADSYGQSVIGIDLGHVIS
jgi:N-acetylglutamate synthase-like GNAT family acetyltransferase